MDRRICLVVQFNWPRPLTKGHGQMAKHLHEVLQGKDWIEEILAASSGIGGGPSSMWVFRLSGYEGLERLFHDQEDPVSQAYTNFISEMVDVEDFVREEVVFL